jgi:hypothetical protein
MHSEKVLWAYQIMLVADDALAVTTSQRLIRFYDDDIERAQRWVREHEQGSDLIPSSNGLSNSNRDGKSGHDCC